MLTLRTSDKVSAFDKVSALVQHFILRCSHTLSLSQRCSLSVIRARVSIFVDTFGGRHA